MDDVFNAKMRMIQYDMEQIIDILPTSVVSAILTKATGRATQDDIMGYKGAKLFYHRNGWLWHALCKVLMPVRLMKRSAFGKSGGITIRALIYSIFLTMIWVYVLSSQQVQTTFFSFVWGLVILSVLFPYAVALFQLLRYKQLYAGTLDKLAEVDEYGQE